MKLDWKWIGIGVLIMLALNILASLVVGMIVRSELEGVTSIDQVSLSNGQIAIVSLLNFLAFVIGGYIVGLKSVGRTILEPGISAAVAVVVGLLFVGAFSVVNVIAGGLVPFLAGLLGGWLGERRHDVARAH
jgi:hypothetical protein